MDEHIETLTNRRAEIIREIAQTGDMRQGSISENYRKCGKPTCSCAMPGGPMHGPYRLYTRKVDGKTKSVNLRPENRQRYQQEVDAYQQFRKRCRELVEINEQICDARAEQTDAETGSTKKKSQTSSKKKSTGKSAASSR